MRYETEGMKWGNNVQMGVKCQQTDQRAVAYLGFQKGGPNFCWPLVLTQRGPNQVFQFFPMVKKNFFCQRGAMVQWPLKYATANGTDGDWTRRDHIVING